MLETEPEVSPELFAQPNALLTSHVAFSSDASFAELRRRAAKEAVRVLRGQPHLNLCNVISQ
ncbi:hypothetical protein LPB72_01855 [Hydrogenophaga crassostreae]|uniref:D-isomer specific 2-hydroxyacid dehydrogenase NAD-binding domain-containing protein n=1 Tax=Hydrogenophaga crassostreae TaxID=1763535 RepID=A0A162SYV6_9BURK|nr:hypothetical protein LPB072_13965 [Hydrogenophaga crassostreae]OAD44253.1 hypothetical protein LPB72_01855 [Hydrogenophaga crassostreae]